MPDSTQLANKPPNREIEGGNDIVGGDRLVTEIEASTLTSARRRIVTGNGGAGVNSGTGGRGGDVESRNAYYVSAGTQTRNITHTHTQNFTNTSTSEPVYNRTDSSSSTVAENLTIVYNLGTYNHAARYDSSRARPSMPHLTIAESEKIYYPTPTIIVFGSPGIATRSIVGMLLGDPKNIAPNENDIPPSNPGVAPAHLYCNPSMFYHEIHDISIRGSVYRLFNVTGLARDTINFMSFDILRNLRNLVYNLSITPDKGASLILFCVKGREPITQSVKRNYQLIFDGVLHRDVPIVLVVVVGENEEWDEERDDNEDHRGDHGSTVNAESEWWDRNRKAMSDFRMQFSAWTWVSINTPFRHVNEAEGYYDLRDQRFQDLVVQHAVFKGVLKIEKEAPVWFVEIIERIVRIIGEWMIAWMVQIVRETLDSVRGFTVVLFRIVACFAMNFIARISRGG
ncbi:hypothetical protein D9757_014353 [Collybiopsis confluens]|uniref:G domain-containing protein n=1 Tax=Collybiopsis confluens TaxID=2823264 RepID=A0A8H5FPH3_9AGAR|nr:hypothetical protein D9757_014353 [Collybiopsis confluens]